jgi:hypothetical protein
LEEEVEVVDGGILAVVVMVVIVVICGWASGQR